MKKLWKALSAWLRADDTLVSLTGHTSSDLRLVRARPDMDYKTPSLVFSVAATSPSRVQGARTIRSSRIILTACGSIEVEASDIAAQVVAMMAPSSPTDTQRRRGADPSNADISSLSMEYVSEDVIAWRPNIDAWVKDVVASCIWYEK